MQLFDQDVYNNLNSAPHLAPLSPGSDSDASRISSSELRQQKIQDFHASRANAEAINMLSLELGHQRPDQPRVEMKGKSGKSSAEIRQMKIKEFRQKKANSAALTILHTEASGEQYKCLNAAAPTIEVKGKALKSSVETRQQKVKEFRSAKANSRALEILDAEIGGKRAPVKVEVKGKGCKSSVELRQQKKAEFRSKKANNKALALLDTEIGGAKQAPVVEIKGKGTQSGAEIRQQKIQEFRQGRAHSKANNLLEDVLCPIEDINLSSTQQTTHSSSSQSLTETVASFKDHADREREQWAKQKALGLLSLSNRLSFSTILWMYSFSQSWLACSLVNLKRLYNFLRVPSAQLE